MLFCCYFRVFRGAEAPPPLCQVVSLISENSVSSVLKKDAILIGKSVVHRCRMRADWPFTVTVPPCMVSKPRSLISPSQATTV